MAHETRSRANDAGEGPRAARAQEGAAPRGRPAQGSDAEDHLKRAHPEMETAVDSLRSGGLDRRAFVRVAALLGASAGVAGAFALDPLGVGGAPRAEPGPDPNAPRSGGALVCAMPVEAIGDPARFDWVAQSNILRHQNEHLTITGADNITRPMLAESWAASDDLRTWTFSLRPAARWRSGKPFTAEDVRFNFARWLDPETGSSNRSLFAALPGPEAVEVVDPLTLRLHLDWPSLSVPESLYNYPTALLPQDFEGDVTSAVASGAGVDGTGAYQLVELIAGERAVLKRVRGGPSYWGGDVPHVGPGWLDEIRYIHRESVGAGPVSAVHSGAAQMAYEIDVENAAEAEEAGLARVLAADSAQTGCMRMRVDTPPFNDPRVRQAIQLACDPEAFPGRVFGGRGRVAEHHHVAPIHPDYFPLTRRTRDLEQAARALKLAGYEDGLDVTLQVGAQSGAWEIRTARLLAEQAAMVGVRIAVDVVSAETYRSIWKSTPFGLTQWTHRPLGTMALALGYRTDAVWNETRFANPKFDDALARAEALIDIRARRRAMEPVQEMLQSDAVMAQPVWAPILSLAKPELRGLVAQPTRYHQFNNVWMAA